MKFAHSFVRHALVAAFGLGAFTVATAADAARHGLVTQGLQLNGPILQGIQFNGPILQGMKLNGPILQGIQFNGPIFQGLKMNGPIIQGVGFNGPVVQGMRINGPVLQGQSLHGTARLTAAFESDGVARATYGLGDGVYRLLPRATDALPGHSMMSGLDARQVRVRRAAR